MAFKYTQAHYRQSTAPPVNIAQECEAVEKAGKARTIVQLPNRAFMYMSEHYPAVMQAADLDKLPDKLPRGEEMGFSPIFDPTLVDQCCVRGIFPLTLQIGQNTFVFGPKLHIERSLCALVDTPEQLQAIRHFPFSDGLDGVFQQNKLHVSRRLLRLPNPAARSASFDVFVNRKDDWVDALGLIRAQHSESWLCEALRRCFYWILLNPDKSTTKVFLTVIRRHRYDGDCEVKRGEINEGDIVAAELGYLVGDIYASATGAYCMDGAGTLQLAVTGEIAKRLGCKVWDVGMKMDYKKNNLGCVELRRKKWQTMVAERRGSTVTESENAKELLTKLHAGCPVAEFIVPHAGGGGKPSTESIANPESKSQRKMRAKIERYQRRKLEKNSSSQ